MDSAIKKKVIINNIKLHANYTSFQNTKLLKKLKNVIRLNNTCLYRNSDYEKELVITHLNNRFELTESVNDVLYGEKNLLYFSAFLSDDYVELLDMCLKSIVKHTPLINFDLLLITDRQTKEKISKLTVISSFNVDYMILPPVVDGPDASMKKLNIFDYEKINHYRKILFLDIDSLCVKDLNNIFNLEILPNTFYVSYSAFTTMQTLTCIPFGIMHFSESDANFFYDNHSKIMPFNAGQFLMINSLKMRMHFENVRWLASAWPGPYFYEQSFMNYYFVFKNLVKLLSHDGINKLICVVGVYWNGEKTQFNFFDFFENPEKNSTEINNKKLVVTGATKSNFSLFPEEYVQKESDLWNTSVNVSTEHKYHDENSVVIHFAGFGPGPVSKRKCMLEYVNRHNLHI